MEQTHYVFRQPQSIDELKALLILRYGVYRESRMKKYVEGNNTGVDLDCFDLNSIHFGLYEHNKHRSRPVGYIRVVTDTAGPMFNEVLQIADVSSYLFKQVSRITTEPLPLLEYVPYAKEIKEFYTNQKQNGEKVVEPSRLSLDRSVRSRAISSFMVSAIFGAAVVEGIDHALIVSHAAHSEFYKKFGFELFKGTSDFYQEQYEVHDVILHGTPQNLPGNVKEAVFSMAEAYFNTGMICYYPEISSQHYPVAESYIESKPIFMAAA